MARRNEIIRMEMLSFAAMILSGCMEMATLTIAKAAMNAGLSSLIYVVYYHFLGLVLLLPGFIIQRQRRNPLPLTFSMLSRCFIIGLLGTCLGMNLSTQGVNYSSPTLSASISNLIPGFTFVLSMLFRMEKFEPKKTSWQAKSVGTVVSIIGASVMTLYEGSIILGSSSSSSSTSQSLMSQSSNWVLGGVMLLAAKVSGSGSDILQTAVLKDYSEQITVVFFCSSFGSINCAIVSLLVERKLDAWKLQPGIEITAVLLSAFCISLFGANIHAFCLNMKGPLYVSMFRPLGILISAILNLVFLADAIRLGSVIGFYSVMWGMSKEICCEVEKKREEDRARKAMKEGEFSSLSNKIPKYKQNVYLYRDGRRRRKAGNNNKNNKRIWQPDDAKCQSSASPESPPQAWIVQIEQS